MECTGLPPTSSKFRAGATYVKKLENQRNLVFLATLTTPGAEMRTRPRKPALVFERGEGRESWRVPGCHQQVQNSALVVYIGYEVDIS